jgi:hypothetical protein
VARTPQLAVLTTTEENILKHIILAVLCLLAVACGGISNGDPIGTGEEPFHGCKITHKETLPWGEVYSVAGLGDRFVFVQNEQGREHPAIQRNYSAKGKLLSTPTELPDSSWETSIFSSPTGFVITTGIGTGPGSLIKLDAKGNLKKQTPMQYVIGNGGVHGFDVIVTSEIQVKNRDNQGNDRLFVIDTQLVTSDGELGGVVEMTRTLYSSRERLPVLFRPATAGDTVAIVGVLLYENDLTDEQSTSWFYIRPINMSTEGVFVPMDDDVFILDLWSDGTDYFAWYVRKDQTEEGVYRIGQDGTIQDSILLNGPQIAFVQRPSGFATLTGSDLTLHRYTSEGQEVSTDILLPGYRNDGFGGVAFASADDDHYLVATTDDAKTATRLHFVTCNP